VDARSGRVAANKIVLNTETKALKYLKCKVKKVHKKKGLSKLGKTLLFHLANVTYILKLRNFYVL